jgi:hypothetical protein
MAHDRLHDTNNYSDPWSDLEPHRSTSAVIGILNMKDCRDTSDLWRAEENLIQWARRYVHPADREDITIGANDRHVLLRLFVFDSFDEGIQQRVNLNATRLSSNQLVAFPPLEGSKQMIVLHWNVVVNDLAVALFRNTEKKIRSNDDAAGKSYSSRGGEVGKGEALSSSFRSISEDGSGTSTATTTTTTLPPTSSHDSMEDAPRSAVGVGGRFKNALDITRKAIANRQETGQKSTADDSRFMSSSHMKLVTPLDLDANDTVTFSSRDLEALKRRDAGRREKRSADLSLLAGSPIDAYERYTRAAELTRHSHDPLWYASALEGCAVSVNSVLFFIMWC